MQRYLEILPLLLRFVFFSFLCLGAVGLGQFELVKFLPKILDIFFFSGRSIFFFFRQLNIFAYIVEGQVV